MAKHRWKINGSISVKLKDGQKIGINDTYFDADESVIPGYLQKYLTKVDLPEKKPTRNRKGSPENTGTEQ